ncbi:MAG: GNAT family N-acetyltransferase [Anaerovoracaceae bacterium]
MKIDNLYPLTKYDEEKLVQLYLDAFKDYPKLQVAFPEEDKKKAALESTVRFYVAYDLHFGQAFSLDSAIGEAVCVVHSDDMAYNEESYSKAGCRSDRYKKAMAQLTPEEQARQRALFDEVDRLEDTLDFPYPHLYLDFLGVKTSAQHQGRGRKLMSRICDYATSKSLPLMLFTNTSDDVKFYESLGFNVVAITESSEFGFVNTYLVKGA